MLKKLLFCWSLALVCCQVPAQSAYFYPQAGPMNPAVPTPEQFLGYPVGTHHTRYDRMVAYFQELDRASDRVTLETIGETPGKRPVLMLKVTAPANHARLEDIRQANLRRADVADKTPLVVQIGANVHGNEPSGGESTLLTAYYLAASESEETRRWLNEMVILIVPVINPDGRDRFNTWVNMHKGSPVVADPADREHNEAWPGGRTNHYWFDLNRDWYLCVHPETQALVRQFHQWRPYVVVDHHEMGTNSTFYFDPGKPTSDNPLVPSGLYTNIYPRFAKHFSQAMNSLGSLYFTKEVFDKLYPGYGSSYANFYGGAGFLFEQASSRGHVQETSTGTLPFAFTIRNQFTAALATLRASLIERNELVNLRLEFFRTTAAQAKKNPVRGYIFGDGQDENRTHAFVNLLLRHQVDCYELNNDQTVGGKTFAKGKAYVVPTEQTNSLMVRTMFEKSPVFADSLFYDASAWSVIHSFGLPFAELRGTVTMGKAVAAPLRKTPVLPAKSSYAYLVDWADFRAPQALYQLLQGGAVVQTAFKPFSAAVGAETRKFGYGTLVVPVQQQRLHPDSLHALLVRVGQACQTDVHPLTGGFSTNGIDLGSNSVRTIRKPEAALLVGTGVSGYEAGEVWHLLDIQAGMPITKVEAANFSRLNLNRYNTLVMVGGTYNLDKPAVDRLKAWIASGGTLVTLKNASEWVVKQGLAKEKLVSLADTAKNKTAKRLPFDEAVPTEGAKLLGGAVFEADLDITHPVGFGYRDQKIFVYRNGLTIFQPSRDAYNAVVQYAANPLVSGYCSRDNQKRLANTPSVLVNAEGQGRIVLFADNPNFRGVWHGTNRMFLNALFFGSLIAPPVVVGEED